MNHNCAALLGLLLGLSFAAFAQDTTYLSSRLKPIAKPYAKYIQVVNQRDGLTERRIFFLEGQLSLLETYADEAMKTPEGVWEDYYTSGSLRKRNH